MKKILIALMFVATPALAEEWFELENQAGGRIILFKEPCAKNDGGRVVLTTAPDGVGSSGCWYNRAEAVLIVWTSGDTSSFEQSAFTYKTRKSGGKKK